ncbi:MAG: hypothetical protein Q9162_006380 [Coniocarpon cinnabarinum]
MLENLTTWVHTRGDYIQQSRGGNAEGHPLSPPPTPVAPFQRNEETSERSGECTPRARRDSSPAHFINKMRATPEELLHGGQDENSASQPERQIDHYFFYGSLMDSATLARALGVEKAPRLRPAKVTGYGLERHDGDHILVNGHTGEEVIGAAAVIDVEEYRERLANFCETGELDVATCHILFEDDEQPKELTGETFICSRE